MKAMWRLASCSLWLAATVATAAPDDALQYRQRATITVQQPAPWIRLPLPLQAYAHSQRPGLADLRVLDSRGERIPFAVLPPRAEAVQRTQRWQEARLYPLPPRSAADGSIGSPLQLTIEGGRISVRQRGGAPAAARSPGWLFDLGEHKSGEPPPQLLRLQWREPAEFSAGYRLEHSADLKQWRAGGFGQVMALAAVTGALTQPDVPLPNDVQRFVRLVWSSPESLPSLTAVQVARTEASSVTVDAPTEVALAPSAEPVSEQAGAQARRALHFDLGALVPVARLTLELPESVRVLPVQIQLRERADAPWQTVASKVFYRPEPEAAPGSAASHALGRETRWLRLVVDERSALPAAESVRLRAELRLASLVFAGQGAAPYALLAGSAKAEAGALPLSTLLPDLERERERFGRAALGPFAEVREAAEEARSQERKAALRPWLLWGVLVAGVAVLALMVWRLARGGGAQPK